MVNFSTTLLCAIYMSHLIVLEPFPILIDPGELIRILLLLKCAVCPLVFTLAVLPLTLPPIYIGELLFVNVAPTNR